MTTTERTIILIYFCKFLSKMIIAIDGIIEHDWGHFEKNEDNVGEIIQQYKEVLKRMNLYKTIHTIWY